MVDAGKSKSVAYWAFATVIIALLVLAAPDFDAVPQPSTGSRPSEAPEQPAAAPMAETAAPRSAASTVTPDEWNEQVEPPHWNGDAIAVKVRFRVHPAGAEPEGDFTRGHPVALWADGKLVSHTDQEHGLRVPAGTRAVLFKALGYQSVTRDVPPDADDTVDFGAVVFEPDAAVRVYLSNAPVDGGEVRLVVGKTTQAPYAQAICTVTGGKAEALLPAPSGEDLHVTAFTQPTANQNTWFASQATPIRLRAGETGIAEVRPLPGTRITVQVLGPSPALLPHLTVMLRSSPPTSFVHADRDAPRTTLDPHGRAVFLVRPFRFEVGIPTDTGVRTLTASDGSGSQQTPTDDVQVTMQPMQPLVGVIVRKNGTAVPSRLSLRGPTSATTPQALCHVISASELGAVRELSFSTETADSRACNLTDLQTSGDLFHIDVERLEPQAHLTVRADIPSAYNLLFEVTAEPEAGGAPISFTGIRSPFQAQLPAGSYRLRWKCSGGPGPTIVDRLVLASGEQREVTASVPAVEKWQAHIVDPPPARGELGLLTGAVNLHLGEHRSLPGTTSGGGVSIYLPTGSIPASPAELYVHPFQMNVPVAIQALDQSRRSFAVVHSLTKADCVRFTSRGLGKGKRQILLANAAVPGGPPALLGEQALVPMLPGSERTGCLTEQVGTERQVTCWFTARHDQRDLPLEPRGHWTTVRIERDGGVVQVEGSAGMPPFKVGQLREPGECRIFVADGTRAVHVLKGSASETFPPEQTEIVVR